MTLLCYVHFSEHFSEQQALCRCSATAGQRNPGRLWHPRLHLKVDNNKKHRPPAQPSVDFMLGSFPCLWSCLPRILGWFCHGSQTEHPRNVCMAFVFETWPFGYLGVFDFMFVGCFLQHYWATALGEGQHCMQINAMMSPSLSCISCPEPQTTIHNW